MERINTTRALQSLYLKGVELYKDLDTNISPERRMRYLTEAIHGWNRCQKEIEHGRRSN